MITLIRELYHKEGTIGKLIVDGKKFCSTLERPENGNKPDDPNTQNNDAGCIPEGHYILKKDYLGRFQYFKVLNVPNREYIEIHQANKIDELLGCIALGEKILENFKYKGKNYRFWLSNSTATCNKLKTLLNEETILKITSNRSLCK